MSYVQKGRGAVSHAQRGMGVKVITPITLEVSENGTIKAPAGFAYDTVVADVPNPNYVETITGTIADPWGTYTTQDLFDLVKDGDATVYIEIAAVSGVRFFPRGYSRIALFRHFQALGTVLSTVCDAYVLTYDSNDSLTDAMYLECRSGGITVTSIPTDTVTTLTIIRHPLPVAGNN